VNKHNTAIEVRAELQFPLVKSTLSVAGDLYWRYDASQFPEVPASYPKPVAEWGSIEGHVDDVLYVNSGYMYFFTNGSYYRYNCATAQVKRNASILRLIEFFQNGTYSLTCDKYFGIEFFPLLLTLPPFRCPFERSPCNLSPVSLPLLEAFVQL
jgi:hypothetical protein